MVWNWFMYFLREVWYKGVFEFLLRSAHNIEIFLILGLSLLALASAFSFCFLCVMKKRRSPAPGTNERMEATAFLSEITNTIL